MCSAKTKTRDERMHELLYSNEGRVEQCERICRLESLVFDCLAVLCGWTMALNEHMGYDKFDATTPTAQTFTRFQERARELGVPDV